MLGHCGSISSSPLQRLRGARGRHQQAVRLVARREGVLLDPVYTGKAMAGLIGLTRQGYFTAGQRVLFIHTGGTPVLFQSRLEDAVAPAMR